MNCKRTFKLLVDLPFLKKGAIFIMYDSTDNIHWIDNGKETEIPLRVGIAGYLWLLATERKYMKLLESDWEDK